MTTPAARWCAVTGGRGFMARHLVAMLLRSGEWRVRVLDLGPAVALGTGEEEAILGAAIRDGRAAYVSSDVRNLAHITKAFEGVDVVFHTAAPNPMDDRFELHHSVNVQGTKNIIDACTACKVKRLIYTSSNCVVFDGVHGLFDVDESAPYPNKFFDAYTQTKAEAEKLVMEANGRNGLLTCCIRPSSILGPGGILSQGLASMRIGRIQVIVGDGKNNDDYVYVENVAYGHICAEKALSTEEGAMTTGGQAYFITNMEPVNTWDFASLFMDELGYKSELTIKIPTSVIIPMVHVIYWAYKVFSHFGVHETIALITPVLIKYITINRTFSCKKANDHLAYKPIVSLKNANGKGKKQKIVVDDWNTGFSIELIQKNDMRTLSKRRRFIVVDILSVCMRIQGRCYRVDELESEQ